MRLQRVVAGAAGTVLAVLMLNLSNGCSARSKGGLRTIAVLWLLAELYFLSVNV
jgi:hypothetical protein